MTKPISDYTIDELSKKIESIKAERERTANALKRYEEELERKKQEALLGVPLKGTLNEMPCEAISRCFLEWFSSEASADKFANYFYNFVEALQKLAKDEPIDITVLLPLMKKGYVAMDEDGRWFWYKYKPTKIEDKWRQSYLVIKELFPFNLKPVENWETSLMECGL